MFRSIYFQLLILLLTLSCANKKEILRELFTFPKSISESSAVEITDKSDAIWTLQDSGNEAELYALNANGTLKNTVRITNAKNNDWEDLTSDEEGNLYIGDFGNNDNERKDLSIYKVNAADLNKSEAAVSKKIMFYYPEQTSFPPKKSERIFDVESFFYYQNNFYLFTKNRSSKFNGETTLYQVPNQEGNHAAKKISTFKTCAGFSHCAVTSADISPDGKKAVILSSTFIWVFTNFKGNDYFSGDVEQIDLQSFTQKEGICFKDNNTLYISDEKKKKTGGKLYELNLSELKSKS